MANVAAGFEVYYGERITVTNVVQLDAIQAVIGMGATGLISLVVLALSEVVGSDVQVAAKIVAREAAKVQAKAESERAVEFTPNARATRKANKVSEALSLIAEEPAITLTDLGQRLGTSRQTAKNYVTALVERGDLVCANGNYEVCNER